MSPIAYSTRYCLLSTFISCIKQLGKYWGKSLYCMSIYIQGNLISFRLISFREWRETLFQVLNHFSKTWVQNVFRSCTSPQNVHTIGWNVMLGAFIHVSHWMRRVLLATMVSCSWNRQMCPYLVSCYNLMSKAQYISIVCHALDRRPCLQWLSSEGLAYVTFSERRFL